MTQHKWAKEIKAWADGEKVYGRMDTHKSIIAEFEVNQLSQFDIDSHSFYIKPQPKQPKYLYAYIFNGTAMLTETHSGAANGGRYIGKIEVQND